MKRFNISNYKIAYPWDINTKLGFFEIRDNMGQYIICCKEYQQCVFIIEVINSLVNEEHIPKYKIQLPSLDIFPWKLTFFDNEKKLDHIIDKNNESIGFTRTETDALAIITIFNRIYRRLDIFYKNYLLKQSRTE